MIRIVIACGSQTWIRAPRAFGNKARADNGQNCKKKEQKRRLFVRAFLFLPAFLTTLLCNAAFFCE
jgi:hypothetical protein